ncbi:LysR family transcriptional regulator [Sinorhizobium medicae]|uniref:Transcriptional regulator, LysR family n=2 Tax=Sinorhizobium medicae TaxID=110321 RepID=A0A508XB15_9HYPH|nr:LysR family transcriptional regulator [Sinorhizobium medicae]MDX0633592.1 LysR family transcriptional regulator [Sinorhizobium medicae]MDX0694547.1 LysR family transcriptional regulator [Sinorhizobium medicae]MDX0743730.1 LysR family transcriptional regulator [Sinorhizobium medicae]VTZ60153.1 Transcriptional regulator, LysR family [Sinorhizobium medicae]
MDGIVYMREVDLRGADLNLLVVLNALLEERSVTRAATRLGMSQPAASRALARLRILFSDAILVDGPGGYLPTARAEEMRPSLRNTLAGVSELLDGRTFDPMRATGSVRLLMLDLEAAVLAPRLIASFAEQAPAVDLQVVSPGLRPLEALEADAVDAVIGVVDEAPAGIRKRKLYQDGFVTLMRAEHPAANRKLTLERFLALDHVVVSITGTGPAWVDEILARLGRQRRVKVRVPSFFAAVEIAARSDLVITLPSSLARTADMRRFAMTPPPLDLGSVVMSLAWHARNQDAPRHVWLRRTIVTAVSDIGLS